MTKMISKDEKNTLEVNLTGYVSKKVKRQVITISLPPELVVWLNEQPLSQGKEIEKIINQYRRKYKL